MILKTKRKTNLWVLGKGDGKDFIYQKILTNKCERNDRECMYSFSAIILIPLTTKVIIYIFKQKILSIHPCIYTWVLYLHESLGSPANMNLKTIVTQLILCILFICLPRFICSGLRNLI